jgi:hypothetical protein
MADVNVSLLADANVSLLADANVSLHIDFNASLPWQMSMSLYWLMSMSLSMADVNISLLTSTLAFSNRTTSSVFTLQRPEGD